MQKLAIAITLFLLGCTLHTDLQAVQDSAAVDFSRDIRPILSDTCYKCHGPDSATRQADLRLDSRENVFEHNESVVPGDLDESELYQRLVTEDQEMLMPPPESGRELSAEQIDLIRRWIEQGAEWGPHWSLAQPKKQDVQLAEESWVRNPIDRFVLRRLNERSLSPADQANRRTLARRLSLDLTGLPPTVQQVEQFLDDDSPEAYERYVDRLIDTPQFGEHMARYWLDVVRYGDTHGLHLDNYREHWPYRDWIINAFNDNQPYDQFCIEQLAGDLLDNPTRDQIIATGFNRAHVTTAEGGSIKEEVRVRNVVDRTATFGTVHLGLTVGCAQCHDHKFDPISQKEFFSLYAYFNSIDGDPMDGNNKSHAPVLMVGNKTQLAELEKHESEIKRLIQELTALIENWDYVEPDDPPAVNPEPIVETWIDDTLPNHKIKHGAWKPASSESDPIHSGKTSFVHKAQGNQQYFVQNVDEPWIVNEQDELFAYIFLDPADPPREVMLQWNDGSWEHRAIWGEDLIGYGTKNTHSRRYQGPLPKLGEWVRLAVPVSDVNLKPNAKINGVALTQYDGTVYWDSIGKVSHLPPFPANRSFQEWVDRQSDIKGEKLPPAVKKLINTDSETRTDKQNRVLLLHFLRHVCSDTQVAIKPLLTQIANVTKQRDELKASIPTTLVYRETKEPRKAYLLERGQYDQPGEEVSRAVPTALPALPAIPDGKTNDRLALANWLFADNHPLTARVAVNRFWQQLFGSGLVETAEDFGAQGTFPTHPDLLDFLAVDFRENGWDVKRLMKQMVLSSTYRQSSASSAELNQIDPKNELLARGRRYRLDAEVIRDQALVVSGLLVETVGGPSVKPPQPDGLWFIVGYSGSNTVRFAKDQGHDKVHRRSMYTFWKRTAPAPQMNIMDAPSRETCVVRRERTNTPLQALMLMNDPQFVEAARFLAQRTVDSEQPAANDKIQFMFQNCLARPANEKELKIIADTLAAYEKSYEADVDSAKELIAIGEQPADEKYNAVELAAWTMIASLIMNMDEFVTRN